MEEPIKDPLDVSNELAERDKQREQEKTIEHDSGSKFDDENEQRPHSTELVILNPSDVIIDKIGDASEIAIVDNKLVNQSETVQKQAVALSQEIAPNLNVTKIDDNRNEIEHISSSPTHESSSKLTATTLKTTKIDNDVEKLVLAGKMDDKIEMKETVMESVEKKEVQKPEITVLKESEEVLKIDDDANSNKNEATTTAKVQSDFQNISTPEKSLLLPQNLKEGEICENNSSSCTLNVKSCSINESSKQNDSDDGNKSVLKQETSSNMTSNDKNEKNGDSNVEEEEVSVSFLDRVIKHALNNTLPIGNFDSTKPFDMVNRRPGGLPNFSQQASNVTSTSNTNESSSSVSGTCDNSKENVISDLKGSVIKKADDVVLLERSSSSSQNLPIVPKQETMSENQNLVKDIDKQNILCDATDANKSQNDNLVNTESDSNFVQQPVVTSSMSMNVMPIIVVQSTSQINPMDDQSLKRNNQDFPKNQFTRQEIIDKKYKTKEDLKNARMVASRIENEQTLNLSLSHPPVSVSNLQNKKTTSIYVSSPDFSKKIFAAPDVTKNLVSNPLHVPPPDFNRAATQTKELQIPNPVFKLKGEDENNLYKQNYHSSVPMTQEKLAEMSKTHNYIPDLRLKSQTIHHSMPVIQAHSSHKPSNTEEAPLPHIIRKEKYQNSSEIQNTYLTPVRMEAPKHEQLKIVEPKIHYPPYKHMPHKDTIESQQQYKREQDLNTDMHFKHLRMDLKEFSSHHVNKSIKVPYTDQHKYLIEKHQSPEDRKQMYKQEATKYNFHELQQKEHEFSLKEKERQLRQEGTIITVKTSNDAKVFPHSSHHTNVYPMQSQQHSSGSNTTTLEPAKLTKENVDRHLREIKHLYPPGHPALTSLSKDMSLNTKPLVIGEQSYQKLEHIPEQHKQSGYYQSYNDNIKGTSFQKHSGYVHPPLQKSGSSEIAYYPNPSISPHGPVSRTHNNLPMGSMNPPMNWPNQKISPSPNASSVSPINHMIPTAASPVFIHPSSKHSPTQFNRPIVAQSPTHNNNSVSPQLPLHLNQYRHTNYSPVQQKASGINDDKYRDRRVAAAGPAVPSRHVVVYETGSRKYEYGEVPKNMRLEQTQQYPVINKYGQQIQSQPPHDVPLRHTLNHENINLSPREYEMHKYTQYGSVPERIDLRRSESDLARTNYTNEVPMHKQDDYRSHSLDRVHYERQKEYEYRRSRMISASPTESYKIQLDISAAIKHETNRNESSSLHHDSYHSGPNSRATMEVQSSPSPSHYQASILIRPSPSTSNSRMDPSSSHIKTETYVPSKEIRTELTPTVLATPQHSVQSLPSVVSPLVKRESPLDLSVKTVKTKADSTGSDLSQQMYRRVGERYVAPKVEFQPNFMQHQSGIPRSTLNERNHRDQLEHNHVPLLHHSLTSTSNVTPKYSQISRSASQNFEPVPNQKNLSHIVHHSLSEEVNVKYAEQSRHRNQDILIKGPHQGNERTIHVEVGTPYRQNILPPNTHKSLQRQEPLHLQHPPYPLNDQAGSSNFKSMPVVNQTRGSVINNLNDPQRLEDRKYVESILYKKQPPPSAIANAEITFRYVHDKHTTPRPVSPRKRPSNYNETIQVPSKQIRYGVPTNEIPSQFNASHQRGHLTNYSHGVPEQKSTYIREPGIEIHAHKMIYERYPPETRTIQSNSQYTKPSNDLHQPSSPHIYVEARQPEPNSHSTVVKTISKDSFRHDPKDNLRAGFPPGYSSGSQTFFPKPRTHEDDTGMQQKQTAITWHPSAPSSRVIQQTFDRFDVRNQYNASADALVSEKCEQTPSGPLKPVGNNSAVSVETKANLQIPEQVEVNSLTVANKGADINTINKLRNSIEQKEMERQRVLMRKQNSSEISEDDNNKADIASILAARIRTKGELKGFTTTSVVQEPHSEIPKDPIQPPPDIEGTSAFDVMDWGNACNDFVDQLKTGKKRGRRKRNTKQDDLHESEKMDPYTNKSEQTDNLSTIPAEVLQHIKEPENFSNSSDEDKPLNLLRQQSTPECKDEDSVSLRKGTETCTSTIKSVSSSERVSQSIRKKQRLVLEQKLAARIGTGSSSDTEPEDKPSARARKRKLRTRSSLGMKESDKSDENLKQDNDSNSELEEKIVKSISQLDGSSDSDNNQDHSSKKLLKRVKNKNVKEQIIEKTFEESEHSEEGKIISKSKIIKRSKSKVSDSESGKDETMTRSKRKLEMEKKISNSKVLRNDKIVQNVTFKKSKNGQEVASKSSKIQNLGHGSTSNKKKDELKPENLKRKCLESDCEQNKSRQKKCMTKSSKHGLSGTSSENDEKSIDDKNDRLRPRKTKTTTVNEVAKNVKRKNFKAEEIKTDKKITPSKKALEKTGLSSQSKFPPGWEAQLYAFKKSLKIPARLINVDPNNQRYSTSLPDLDQSSDDASEFSETSKASSLLTHIKTEETEIETSSNRKIPLKRSIIDLLHQRVTPSLNNMILKKKKQKELTNFPSKSTDNEVLSMPVVQSANKSTSCMKKSIFELSVLKSRTRNEQKHLKHKEIIREIFCGEDRPSSAPPLGLDLDTTFDQKFGQIMKKIDDVVASTSTKIKEEKTDDAFMLPQDEETTDTILNVNNDRDNDDLADRDLDTPSVNSERDIITPTSFKDMPKPTKRSRQSRRKQSSGFDYIRKKKKPAPTNSDGTPIMTKRRIAAVNYLQEKDETDISKEVKGWVLNKGVGECYLHKAARLGYLDVIAYCLFRIDMDVDTKDNAGYTALHEACSKGNLGIVRLLLQCGANHSETAFSGIRPLHEAVQNNYTEIARLLLAYGADPSLSTYSGQTPEMLAETKEMSEFLSNYLKDMQGGISKTWQPHHPWQQCDSDTEALDIFDGVSELFNETGVFERRYPVKTQMKNSNLNNIIKDEKIKYKSCSVVLNNIDHLKSFRTQKAIQKSLGTIDSAIKNQFGSIDSDSEMFEIEESEYPLPPLYLLQDEGSDKWIMLSDLCNILKVKSKDAVLKQIDPNTPTSSLNKELVRELKLSDFIEKATCLQLLCAGEKLNARSSKVVLIRYNDAVKNLLNIQTIVLKF